MDHKIIILGATALAGKRATLYFASDKNTALVIVDVSKYKIVNLVNELKESVNVHSIVKLGPDPRKILGLIGEIKPKIVLNFWYNYEFLDKLLQKECAKKGIHYAGINDSREYKINYAKV